MSTDDRQLPRLWEMLAGLRVYAEFRIPQAFTLHLEAAIITKVQPTGNVIGMDSISLLMSSDPPSFLVTTCFSQEK